MLIALSDRVASFWTAWKDEATETQREQFWNHADELKDHVIKIFELADDAGDDVIAMAMLMSSMIKRLFHPEETRALSGKSLSDCVTVDDLANFITTHSA